MRTKRKGQVMVETLLILPLLLLIMVAFFEIGRGMFAYQEIDNAAYQGARAGSMSTDPVKIAKETAKKHLDKKVVGEFANCTVDATIERSGRQNVGVPLVVKAACDLKPQFSAAFLSNTLAMNISKTSAILLEDVK